MHQPPPTLERRSQWETYHPSEEADVNGLFLVFLCVLSFWDKERKGCLLGTVAKALAEPSRAFQPVLCVSVIFYHATPSLFAKYLKMFPEGSELLTNLGKMLWKTPSTKTDLYS